ncbi:MAG: DUF4468 domain-containing protein [Tannerella sp.]|jgi:hypothetical protein|nr:DUF4468 domain-containing protein [Tannerella sp.]
MKKTILFLLVLIVTSSQQAFSQNIISYTEVVNVADASEEDLYKSAKTFLQQKSANIKEFPNDFTIQADFTSNFTHQLSAARNQLTGGNKNYTHVVKYTITIQIRDGRYKYTIPKVFHENGTTRSGSMNVKQRSFKYEELISADTPIRQYEKGNTKADPEYVYVKEYMDDEINKLIVSLKNAMSKKITDSDDW